MNAHISIRIINVNDKANITFLEIIKAVNVSILLIL